MPNIRQELLPIVVQENNALIDAKLLHRKLKVGTRFNDWFRRRATDYGFENAKDYYSNLSNSEILLTLDMAKELAMLERNEVGRQIRRYFIAKEKELRGLVQLPAAQQLFKGIKASHINGRNLYPYREMLVRCGYKSNSNGGRRHRYPQHFILMGNILFITEEFALHLHHQKQVFNNRIRLHEMQPVLPFDFGSTAMLQKGGRS